MKWFSHFLDVVSTIFDFRYSIDSHSSEFSRAYQSFCGNSLVTDVRKWGRSASLFASLIYSDMTSTPPTFKRTRDRSTPTGTTPTQPSKLKCSSGKDVEPRSRKTLFSSGGSHWSEAEDIHLVFVISLMSPSVWLPPSFRNPVWKAVAEEYCKFCQGESRSGEESNYNNTLRWMLKIHFPWTADACRSRIMRQFVDKYSSPESAHQHLIASRISRRNLSTHPWVRWYLHLGSSLGNEICVGERAERENWGRCSRFLRMLHILLRDGQRKRNRLLVIPKTANTK